MCEWVSLEGEGAVSVDEIIVKSCINLVDKGLFYYFDIYRADARIVHSQNEGSCQRRLGDCANFTLHGYGIVCVSGARYF